MPESLKQMAALAFRDIANKPQPPLHVKHKATMQHRFEKPAVSIVAGNKQVKSVAFQPSLGFHVRNRTPCKRSFRNSLIEAVNFHCVVSSGAAELVALFPVRDRAGGAGIDQKALSLDREPDSECVGMPVAGVARTLRSCIDHKLLPI